MSETKSFDGKSRGGGGRGGFRSKPYDRENDGGGFRRGGGFQRGGFQNGRGGGGHRGGGGYRGGGRGRGGDRGHRGGGRGGNRGGGRGGFNRPQGYKNASDHGFMPLPDEVENRLAELRNSLNAKGTDPEEIKQILRTERRNAENENKKFVKNACYRCRSPGHKLADCPQAKSDTINDVCYKCGSTEHKLFECKSKKPGLDFAKCFICSEEGHISRECPQNSRGAYPRGGACKICESVTHLAKDCPENNKDDSEGEPEEELTLDTMGDTGSADAQDFIPIKGKKKPKVVKF